MKTYEVKLLVDSEAKNRAEAAQEIEHKLAPFGVVRNVKPISDKRTLSQNAALHLLFTQLAEELTAKGFDMRTIIRDDIEIEWTPWAVKHHLWKKLQKALIGKKSTTQLSRHGDIEVVYDNLNKIITERTKGEVSLPPFPSKILN